MEQKRSSVDKTGRLRRRTETDGLVHELEARQAELQLQNEELRKAQAALRKSEESYQNLYDLAPVGYFTVGKNYMIADGNLSGCALLGVERGCLTTEKITQFISPECQDIFYVHHKSVLETSKIQTCELTMLKQDGSKFDAELYSEAVMEELGESRHCRIAVLDISKRKEMERGLQEHHQRIQVIVEEGTADLQRVIRELRDEVVRRQQAEESLRRSEKKYRELIESLSEVVFSVDRGGVLTYISPVIQRLSGYSQLELMGHPFSDFVYPEDVSRISEDFNRVCCGETIEGNEYRFVTKSGEVRWWHSSGRPVFDADRVIGLHGILTDITERKRAEQGVKALSHRLFEIQEAERGNLARELHDEVGQLLNVTKLLLDKSMTADERSRKSLVSEAQSQIVDLITRVSNLSLDLRPRMLDDFGLLDALVWYFRRYTDLTQVVVDFEHLGLDRNLEPQVANSVYRILQEALTNVARHARVKEAKVSIWNNGQNLLLQVEDKGVGFNPVELPEGKSSGIDSMYERIRLLGGSLKVISAPGDGTCLTVEIPLNAASGTGGKVV